MKRKTLITRSMVALILISVAMVVSPAVNSLPTGVGGTGIQTSGCNCHAGAPTATIDVTLDGLPDQYNSSETYTITVSFEGGPIESGVNSGGFNLWASGGEFTVIDATVQSRATAEVTHTEVGNDYRTWTMEWIAPSHGRNVDFILHVNSVNGDGSNSGDSWNRLDLSVVGSLGVGLDPADPFTVLATLIIISSVLLLITILYGFYRTNPDAFDWDHLAPWIIEWLTSTDHKKIGTLYFIQGLFFLGIGGILAMMIRLQLAGPEMGFISQDQYNQFFTLHGTTMIFLAAMPLINGFANWIVPLQIGAPDLALPRINALSFWLQPFAALLIFTGVFSGQGADTGWTGYAPYVVSAGAHSGVTMWVAGQIMLVASSTLTGINFLTTMAVMRAEGMGWMQMPLFTWSILVANLMLFLSIPAFGIGLIQVYLDRTISTAFYDIAAGGDPLLWSHLFWYFGHPEVYVVIVPGLRRDI